MTSRRRSSFGNLTAKSWVTPHELSARDDHSQYDRRADQSLDHRGLLRVADAVGPLDVPPALVLSRLAVRERAMGARDSSVDRLRAAGELRRPHRAILARQFLEPRRHRLDGRDRAR